MILRHPTARKTVVAPPSKSHAIRLLILAAIDTRPTRVLSAEPCDDVRAVADCLSSLGATVFYRDGGYDVIPLPKAALFSRASLFCGESGAALRFLMPLAFALGVTAEFHLSGRLSSRPMGALVDTLTAHGAVIDGIGTDTVTLSGKPTDGVYEIDPTLSSQYLSGLLLSLPLLENASVKPTGDVVSAPYLTLTLDAMRSFGYDVTESADGYTLSAKRAPAPVFAVEGDWSAAAFLLALGTLSDGITVNGLSSASSQGDRAILDALRLFGGDVTVEENAVSVVPSPLHGITIDCESTPDLVPALVVLAACADGVTHLCGCERLRYKESDRIHALTAMLSSLGGSATYENGTLTVIPAPLHGGVVDSFGDHRIAMAASVLACRIDGDVTVLGCESVTKSYPAFYRDVFTGGLTL